MINVVIRYIILNKVKREQVKFILKFRYFLTLLWNKVLFVHNTLDDINNLPVRKQYILKNKLNKVLQQKLKKYIVKFLKKLFVKIK